MKKVSVFGKPGSGKSTLSKQLAASTGIPLHPLDSIVYQPNGEFVDREIYDQQHREILNHDNWIIDGLGPIASFFERLDAADTLIYIDLPYPVSYWLVTKRLIKGLFVKPEGWPDGSSVWKGSIESYKTLKQCPKFWNNELLNKLRGLTETKTLYVVRSTRELNTFIKNNL